MDIAQLRHGVLFVKALLEAFVGRHTFQAGGEGVGGWIANLIRTRKKGLS
jgi:hypothetical protein